MKSSIYREDLKMIVCREDKVPAGIVQSLQ
jgi:hypothetical protein